MSEAQKGLTPAEGEPNTTLDEDPPEDYAQYEDAEFDVHDFTPSVDDVTCTGCDMYYDEGNHTN